MEVVPITMPRSNSPTTAVGLPFNRRNVEEWSRLDRLTGIMEKAKIETDHWAARSNNAAHNYGKVIDSRERNNPDGSLQERQRKQMEVFQTKVPGGSMQVIRTQTITTSSKKWMSTTTTNEKGFEDLELPVNSLDLSSQKTKGSVGRSGSIGGRRPPTRPRSLISQSSDTNIFGEEPFISTLCQNIHDRGRIEMFKGFSDFTNHNQSLNGSSKDLKAESRHPNAVITDITNQSSGECSTKTSLSRQKSCSNENLSVETDNENILKRSSKMRRSLQFHKHNHSNIETGLVEDFDWSTTKSLKERAAEIENLLRRGSSTHSSQVTDRLSEPSGKTKLLKTRDSFVSAETLKEVRDRLRKSNSSDSEMRDDGIVTEKDETSPSSKVQCFIYGIESLINGTNKKHNNINGTGSLESRSSNKSSTNTSKSSEWYRRRKSYGFEQMDESEKFDKFNNKKCYIDSSTDSGICQSSETMGIPSWHKNLENSWDKIASQTLETSTTKGPSSTIVTVGAKNSNTEILQPTTSNQTPFFEKSVNSIYLNNSLEKFSTQIDNSKTNDYKKRTSRYGYHEESLPLESVWNRKSPITVSKINDTRENLKSSLRSAKNPWISQLRGTKLVDLNWASDEQEESEESKHQSDSSEKQSPVNYNKEDSGKPDLDLASQKKSKKVEFCKTEVHFAAESGKFNIVETDGKPPPNDIFRRRRRNIGSFTTKNPNGLPETKFGDSSFEKRLLTATNNTESISEKIEAELKELSRIVIEALPQSKEKEIDKESTKKPLSSRLYDVEEEPVENGQVDSLKPRSILKNCRKSFLLGETEIIKSKSSNSYDCSAGSPIPELTPVWKSTVTLRNKRYDDIKKRNEDDKKLYSSDGETELQIRIRNLRKIDPDQRKLWENSKNNIIERKSESPKRRSLPDDILLRHSINSLGNNVQKMTISSDEMPSLSVAERIKQVEELKSNNYSTKINFRSGEMTVVQNGMPNTDKFIGEKYKKPMTSWADQKKMIENNGSPIKDEHKRNFMERPLLSCDKITTSNPSVMRFPTHDDKTDNQKYQTTRILINFESSAKGEPLQSSSEEKMQKNNTNKTSERLTNVYGSWSSGMKRDLGRYLNDLKSTTLVKETLVVSQEDRPENIQREDIPKPSKPIHEIIGQFDSLSLPNKNLKQKRRKTIPITYKPVKEYTHSDLEEELKNFTENLDKDFRDIYEEEIGSLRKSKYLKELKVPESPHKIENIVRPIILNRPTNYFSTKSSSDEGSKKSSQRTSSRDNYDTDDSDLLADEEVRSYMSTGHGGTDSETEDAYGSSSSRKSFEDSILRFKKLESQMIGKKEIRNNIAPIPANLYEDSVSRRKPFSSKSDEQPKVASVSLKYEDDPFFLKPTYRQPVQVLKPYSGNTSSNEVSTDNWDKTSNSSSTVSNKPRERVSYLNGLSLSEKYSKYLQRSSNSSLDTVSESYIERIGSRRNFDPSFSKSEDIFIKSKSDNETRNTKSKYSSRNLQFTHSKETKQVESIKEEKLTKEEAKENRYFLRRGTDSSETLRNRTKPNPEKEVLVRKGTQISKYQNQGHHAVKNTIKEREETDSVILEELKKAADQILMAVNGYTDDSSLLGSSEDDDRPRRIIRKDKIGNLGTISEGKRVTKTEVRKTMATNNNKQTNNQSSASSLESLTKESVRTTRECKTSKNKHNDTGKTMSSRTTRLLQRASSREALMPQPSSSEDIPSYLEQAKKRVVRRQKSSASMKSEPSSESKSAFNKSKSKTKNTEQSSTSRSRERKLEKMKESTSVTRSSRSSHTQEGERTKSSSRRAVVDKTDVEATKRKRSQYVSSKDEHATGSSHRRKVTAVKKSIIRASQPT